MQRERSGSKQADADAPRSSSSAATRCVPKSRASPDAHAVVGDHSAHGVVSSLLPLLLAQLQHLLQLLPQVAVSLRHQRQPPELAHCGRRGGRRPGRGG